MGRGLQVIAGFAVCAAALFSVAGSAVAQEPGYSLALDADPSNGDGPCRPVDQSIEVEVGDTFDVAICIVDPPEPVSGFNMEVEYDGALLALPPAPRVPHELDANPDANAGSTTFPPTHLGERWDCTGVSVMPPQVDIPDTPGIFDARIACTEDLGPNPDIRLTTTGPLAIMRVEAKAAGASRMEFRPTTEVGFNPDIKHIGVCQNATKADLIPCRSALIYAGVGAGTPVPTRTLEPEYAAAASTRTALAASRATPVPVRATPAAAPSDDDDGGGLSLAAVLAMAAGALVLVVVGAALVGWRARAASDAGAEPPVVDVDADDQHDDQQL